MKWNFDMALAPRWRPLQIACRIQTSRTHVHRWVVLGEVQARPTFLDYAWRESPKGKS